MIFLSKSPKSEISVLSADALKLRVAEKVIQLRKEKNLTQADMAERFGMSQMAYSKIENGKTDLNLEKLFAFCEILKITLTELLGLDEVISVSAHQRISELEANDIRQKNELAEKSMLIKLLTEKSKDK